jgi:hypothetical protein
MADIRIVSEQSEAEIERKPAEGELDWRLRELAANVLRIVRGAGKPYELLRQMQAVIDASVKFQKAPPLRSVAAINAAPRTN